MARYGPEYVEHPRLENLLAKNNISTLSFLSGKDEAAAFEGTEYVRLHQSTLRKVDVLADILARAADGTLKTNTKWYQTYGLSPAGLGELIKEHWVFVLIGFLAGIASLLGLYFTLWPNK